MQRLIRQRSLIAVGLIVACSAIGRAGAPGGPPPSRSPLGPILARRVDPVIDAAWSRFRLQAAIRQVRYFSQFWRIRGNPGYDAVLDRVHAQLAAAGFQPESAGAQSSAGRYSAAGVASREWFEQYPNAGNGWSYSVGTLAIASPGQPDQVVLSREKQQIALCINSFPTAGGGAMFPLVDVGRGDREGDYAARNVRGAVVLGDAGAEPLWRIAVLGHGAAGIVSTAMTGAVSPDRPGAPATRRDDWEILQWGEIPYDDAHRSFGFKASPRAAAMLREALAAASADAGKVMVRVTIASGFSLEPVRTLVAEIPGRSARDERVVIAAHVQEPGANDNGSGVATLVELARALHASIRAGAIPQPERTITLLWLEEISGSRHWLQDHANVARNVRYMFSMDMTGEDVSKTGGNFLIERWPDPGAVWDRPWDPHTEWGRGDVQPDALKGDLINDLHLAICMQVARKTGWVVKTNPYEGGSDHTVFGSAGIPSVLDWHFTDRFYHTNLDTPDKTSAAEMRNVGVAVAASAWLLASSRESTAVAIAGLVASAGKARIALEEHQGGALAAGSAEAQSAMQKQALIVASWRKWYAEAIRSASRLVVGPVSPRFGPTIDKLAGAFEGPGGPD